MRMFFFFILLCGMRSVFSQTTPVTRTDVPTQKVSSEKGWDKLNGYPSGSLKSMKVADTCSLKKVVFGWYPYWNGTSYTDFDFSLLSDVAYFAYEANPSTGSPTDLHFWKTTPLVDLAKAAGCRVSLTVTLFSGHKSFLESATSRQTLIDSLIANVRLRGASGVNIDFEAVPSSQRNNLTSFMKDLSQQFRDSISAAFISIAIPAVDWSDAFDVVGMEPYVDLFIIMGYDYYYPGSSIAGPVSPKNNGSLWSPYDVTRSVRDYLQLGIPAPKLCLGVPYYGYQWQVSDEKAHSAAVSRGSAVIYNSAVSNILYYTRLWDPNASVPWYTYLSGNGIYQCWFDDATSLGLKYDMVNAYNIAGIGIWALGYDRSRTTLWELLREKFSVCGNTSTDGTFTDMGGPLGNYPSADDYSQTFSTADTLGVSCLFAQFEVTAGDTLFAYDSTLLIGSYSGSLEPFVLMASKVLKFRFHSDSVTSAAGWMAYWHSGAMVLPSSLQLSADTLTDTRPAGAFVGRLSMADTGSYVFSLYGKESNDNAFFRISGDSLFTTAEFYYPDQSVYSLTVSAVIGNTATIGAKDIKILPKRVRTSFATLNEDGSLVYPNPCSDWLTVDMKSAVGLVRLYTALGKEIDVQSLSGGMALFDVSKLPSGIYLVGWGTSFKKIVVQR